MLHQVFRIIRHRNQSEHTDDDENSRLIAIVKPVNSIQFTREFTVLSMAFVHWF